MEPAQLSDPALAPLILASASRVRADLLRAAGLAVDVRPASVDEASVKAALLAEGATGRDVADMLAELKARRIGARAPGRLVLGADQTLVCEGALLEKPSTRAEAAEQLRRLRGRRHALHAAAVITLGPEPIWRHIGTVDLTMRPFSETFLEAYLDIEGSRLYETVGAYRLEGPGVQLFSRVSGDYFSVLGLPLLEVLGFLRARGVCLE